MTRARSNRMVVAQGAKGDQGNQGTQGTQGERGYQGYQGNQGAIGTKGDRGYQGHQGLKGDQGNQGHQGNQGLKGNQGDRGYQGYQGNQGNQGAIGDQGDQGNQGYQGVSGSPPANNTVTYAKIGTDLKNSSVIASTIINWSASGIFTKTLSANTIFTFSNLQLNKVITLILTGNYTITWPSYMDADHFIGGDDYDGTVTNYIQIHCTDAGSGTEEVWWTCKAKGS